MCWEFVVKVWACLAGDRVLEVPGSCWRCLVQHCTSQWLSIWPKPHACSSLSVCLILRDTYINSASHCALFLSLSLFLNLSLFPYLILVYVSKSVSLCVCTCMCTYIHLICMFIIPSSLWNIGVCVLTWGFILITDSRWCYCWGLGAPT